jgi:hypothetical protein
MENKFCSNCGQQLNGESKFCAHCGAPIGARDTNLESHLNQSGESMSVKVGNPAQKILIWSSVFLVGLIIVTYFVLLSSPVVGDSTTVSGTSDLVVTIVNIILGLLFLGDCIWIVLGIVFGAMNISKSNQVTGPQSSKLKLSGIWHIISPIIFFILIILAYVIVQVIARTLTQS